MLIRTLPVVNPGELVLLRSPGPQQGRTSSDGDDAFCFSYPTYRELAEQSKVFAGLIGEVPFSASIAARGETERASGELVTGNYFGVLGVPPAAGRVLTPADDQTKGAHPVAVLSHGYWQRRFGGDPSVLGKPVTVNGQSFTIVGVAARTFEGIQAGRRADLFVPMMMKPQITPFWDGLDDPKDYWLQIVGRLKPGFSRSAAEHELVATYRPILEELLPRMTGWNDVRKKEFLNRKIELLSGARGRRNLQQGFGTPLASLMGMVGLVLLIACSNLAGLLAARGAARQREYGIRLAIGASRAQLLRQSIVECLVFSVVGGALGLLLAAWLLNGLLSAFPAEADLRQVAAQIDPRVLGFGACLSLVAGILFGVGPAYRAARLDPARTLRGQGRGSTTPGREALRLRNGLVIAQVALTLVLLVAAGLFTQSLRNLSRVELGVKVDHVIGFSIAPKLNGYTSERTAALARQLTEDLKAVPGARSVTAAMLGTLAGNDMGSSVVLEGADKTADAPHSRMNYIGPDYFVTLGIPLLEGRAIAWADDASAPKVCVVNETFAEEGAARQARHRPAHRDRRRPGRRSRTPRSSASCATARARRSARSPTPFAYLPYLQNPRLGDLNFYVRAEGDPAQLASALRAAVKRLDPQLPVDDLKTLSTQLKESLLTERLIMMLSVAFGGLAALLAAIGIYGVLAFAVAQRRQEIGVRMALGANPAAVRRLILGEVVRFVLVGAVIGLPVSYAVARVVESILFGVHASDVPVFAFGLLLMAAVALLAGYLPAHRAARIDPLDALRND